jgi:hypothetical protein
MATRFSPFFDRIKSATKIQNQSQLASALGVGRAAISLVKQKDSIPPRWILLLSREYGLDPIWLAGEDEVEDDLALDANGQDCLALPIVELCIDPETGRLVESDQPPWPMPRNWLQTLGNPQEMVLVCRPQLDLGPGWGSHDRLLIDQSQRDIFDGMLAVVALGKKAALRRIWLQPRAIELSADPQSQAGARSALVNEDEFLVLGRVLWSSILHIRPS